MSFSLASAVEQIEPGRYRATADPAWFQGPGVYGGLTAAWLLRAMSDVVGDPGRKPRELSGMFCARIRAGEVQLAARVVRAGLNVSLSLIHI